jgi:iron complex outermembrane receptor protein
MTHRRAALLALGLLTSALAAPADEPPPGLTAPGIAEIVVRSTALPPGVTEIDRETLDASKARTAIEALEALPAIHAVTGARGERTFSLRGFDQRQTAVLIDGLPSAIPADGRIDLRMVPAEMLDHVTIARGPASILYGPNGLGGVVNLVTRMPGTGPPLRATLEVGTPGSADARAVASWRAGRAGFLLAGGIADTVGFALPGSFAPTDNEPRSTVRTNSDRRQGFALGNVAVDLAADHRLRASLFYLDGAKGVPPSTIDRVPNRWRFDPWRALGASVGWEGAGHRTEVDVAAYGRYFTNTLNGYDDGAYETLAGPGAFVSIYQDAIAGARARIGGIVPHADGGATHLRLWLQGEYDRHAQQPDRRRPWETRSRALVTIAPEAEVRPIDPLALIAGMQADVETPLASPPGFARKSAIGWGPLVGVRWTAVPGLTVSATGARRTRFPTLHERFAGGGGRILPNPDLRPEAAWHAQLGVNYSPVPWTRLEADLWDAEVEDLIEQTDLGGGNRRMENTGRARLAGAEVQVDLEPRPWLAFRAGYAFLYARRLDAYAADREIAYKPAHAATLELAVRPVSALRLAGDVAFVGERRYQDPNTREWNGLPPYFRWDAIVEYRPRPEVAAWLKVDNVLDADYETEVGFPDPGRTFRVGLTIGAPSGVFADRTVAGPTR